MNRRTFLRFLAAIVPGVAAAKLLPAPLLEPPYEPAMLAVSGFTKPVMSRGAAVQIKSLERAVLFGSPEGGGGAYYRGIIADVRDEWGISPSTRAPAS